MSDTPRPFPRRAVLAASGTAVLAAAAAACSSGGSAATATPATNAAATPSGSQPTISAPVAPPSAATSPARPSSAPTSSAGDPAPKGTQVASVADVQAAGAVVVQSASGPLLLAYADGTVVAHTAVCTHQQCTIAASGHCPCHGSAFDVTTGALINGPALRPLAEEQVTISGGQVYAS